MYHLISDSATNINDSIAIETSAKYLVIKLVLRIAVLQYNWRVHIYTIYISWLQNWVRPSLRWIKPFPGEFKEGWSNLTKIFTLILQFFKKTVVFSALQICTVKLQWKQNTFKKCTFYKYLPSTVQCRTYSKKPMKISFAFHCTWSSN